MSSQEHTQSDLTPAMRRTLKFLLPLIVVALTAGAAVMIVKKRSQPERVERPAVVPAIRTMQIQLEDVTFAVRSQGTVVPHTASTLIAEVSGKVVEVSDALVSGGFFEEGQPLVSIDPVDYQQARAQAAAVVTQAQLRLAREQADAEVAQQEWDELGEGPGTPLALRELQVAEATASLEAAQAALARTERDLTRTQIRAPYAGRVRHKQVDLGQFVTRGTPIATIYSVDSAEVRLPIPDDQLAFTNLPLRDRGINPNRGPKVRLSTTFGGQQIEWHGRIVRTEGEIDPKTRMVYAIAEVENPYAFKRGNMRPPLAVGMFVQAEIEGHLVKRIAVIPRSALRGENRVLTVDDQQRLRFRTLEIIRLDGESAYVGKGLKQGERICLTPLDTVTEGMLIQHSGVSGAEDAVVGSSDE